MTDRHLQAIIGVVFIFSHLAILALVMVLYMFHGFTFEETTTTVSIIAPIFAGYSLIIVRTIIAERNLTSTFGRAASQSGLFIFLSLFISLSFVAALVAVILFRAFNMGINSFEQFKAMLAIIESTFALYLGPIVQSLFSPGLPSDSTNHG